MSSGAAPCKHRRVTFAAAVLEWYEQAARDLPWRRPEAGPWAVLVSEVMLQQTPVTRVVPVYQEWLKRWPTPRELAGVPRSEPVRMWGRLGYPRRALRLHECAVSIVDRYAGEVPSDLDALLALPGVGPYTARAVATFGFGQRHPVVDTNVRRVTARAVEGSDARRPATHELRLVESLLPSDPPTGARFAAALMELGAVVCTARVPDCAHCPVTAHCRWRAAGYPRSTERPLRQQPYAGTDRHVRGRLLEVLRTADGNVPRTVLSATWHNAAQVNRALDSLLADGLARQLPDGSYALPS